MESARTRPRRIEARKRFPDLLESRSPLKIGKHSSALRRFVYWFPGRGVATGEQNRTLRQLERATQSEEELSQLKQTIRQLEKRAREGG